VKAALACDEAPKFRRPQRDSNVDVGRKTANTHFGKWRYEGKLTFQCGGIATTAWLGATFAMMRDDQAMGTGDRQRPARTRAELTQPEEP
jgi:hypothetical protein